MIARTAQHWQPHMTRYLDDLQEGAIDRSTVEYPVSADEIIAFARRWDPLAFHTDPDADSPYGGLIASGTHTLAIRTWLLHRTEPIAVLGALGWDQLRFPNPVRPDDRLSLTVEFLEVRPSRTKSDRGVVRSRITVCNQHGEPVLSHEDIIMVARRPAAASSPDL